MKISFKVKSKEKITTSDGSGEFQQFIDIDALLERIKQIESELGSPFKSSNRDNEAVIEKFTDWCKDSGANFDKIKVQKLPGYDLGLVAKENLKQDNIFIEIPESMIFSFKKIEDSLPISLRSVPLFAGMSHIRLAFALIVEKLNPKSLWKPYLDILPDKYRTCLYYSPSEMAELKGTAALTSALKHRVFIASQFAFLYKYINIVQDPHPIIQALKENFTYEFYCWAVSTIQTRQNVLPQGEKNEPESVLVPLWDLANHENGTINTSLTINADNVKHIESYCLRDFAANEQIFMCYGNRSNEDFLIHNGFVFQQNTNQNYSIKLSLSKADELYEERVKLLTALGVQPSGLFQISPELSSSMLGFVRVFNMNKDQLTQWIGNKNPKELLKVELKLEKPLEQKISMFLLIRVKLLLKSFPTTMEEDQAILESLNNTTVRLSSIKIMLIQYRILEKMTLNNMLDKFTKQTTK